MKKLLILSFLALGYQSASAQLVTESFGTGANAFTMDFVTIWNPGNAADTTGSPNPAGAVGYIYNIGKHEINRDSFNKANQEGGLDLLIGDMSPYSANSPNRPATGINWFSAAKFVNYLNVATGNQAAYNFNTFGTFKLWTFGDNGFDSENPFRNKNAKFFLPSVDEWYKAAYSDKQGVWFNFANGSDTQSSPVAAGTVGAVFRQSLYQGPADVTNAGELSPWGTMAQGGNVWEWMESAFDGNNNTSDESRDIRGGTWYDSSANPMDTSNVWHDILNPNSTDTNHGFRIVMVPEPSALSLCAVGLGALAILRRQKSRAVDTFVWSILLLVALSFPVRATVSLTDGLVGYYKFEGNFNDSSAVSNNLVPSTNASLTNDRFGNSNAAMSSTSSSYAYTSSNIGVSGFSSRTVSIWAKGGFDDSAFEYFHFGGGWNPLRADGAGGNFAISYVPWKLTNPQRHWPGSISGNIFVDGNYWAYLVTTDPTSLGGLWHQLVYTFDSSNMLSSVYLNGVLQTNNAYADSVDRMNTIPSSLYFSSEGATANITIDDVRIWDRSLSNTEVAALYATERIPEPSALSLLVLGGVVVALGRRKK